MENEISSVILICSGECERGDDLFNAIQAKIKKRLKEKENIMMTELAISKELDGR